MVKKNSEIKQTQIDFGAAGVGQGMVELRHILNAPEEMYGYGRMFAHACLAVGAGVEPHEHQGECEIYYFLSGQGEYYDDGRKVAVGSGWMTGVKPGQFHGLKNTGNIPLEYICLILNEIAAN